MVRIERTPEEHKAYLKTFDGRPKNPSLAKKRPPAQRFEIVVPTCKICQLGVVERSRIDTMLATGYRQAEVLRQWNEMLEAEHGPKYLSPNNISSHARRHITLRESAVRDIIEKRAEIYGEAVEETARFILTREAVVESVVISGLQNIVQGVTMVEAKELLQAVQMLKVMEDELGSVAQDELWRQFDSFQVAVKAIVPEEMWLKIAGEFELQLHRTAPKQLAQQIVSKQTEIGDITNGR